MKVSRILHDAAAILHPCLSEIVPPTDKVVVTVSSLIHNNVLVLAIVAKNSE